MNAVLYLNYENKNIETLSNNIERAGKNIKFIKLIINEDGIANAINVGLRILNYEHIDYVTIMGNDIIEPDNWLAIRNEFMKDKTIGICSIPLNGFNGDSLDLIGNFTMSKETILRVGAFNEELDPYGAIDLDYCTRCRAAGLHTKFIPNTKAIHIEQNGIDAYGYNKMDLVKKTWDLHTKNVSDYSNGNKAYYIPL
jgi:GT2 family glycosyltransferase